MAYAILAMLLYKHVLIPSSQLKSIKNYSFNKRGHALKSCEIYNQILASMRY